MTVRPQPQAQKSLIEERLEAATAETAALQLALNRGCPDPVHFVRWAFSIEALPIFDCDLISKVRALATFGVTNDTPQPTERDVKLAFRAVSRRTCEVFGISTAHPCPSENPV